MRSDDLLGTLPSPNNAPIEELQRRLFEMRRELTSGLVCLVAAISIYTNGASAQDQKPVPPSYPPGLSEALLIQQRADALELSKETRAKLQALIDEGQPIRDELHEKSAESLAKLHEVLDEPLPEKAALLAASNATGEVATRIREERLRITLLARGLLTEEQRAKYMEIRARVSLSRQGGARGGRR